MVGFVFADVEPFAKIVGWSPWPALIGSEKPRVILLAEFGEGFLTNCVEDADVVVAIVALDGGAAGIAKVHGGGPPFFGFVGAPNPTHRAAGVYFVGGVGFR